LFILASADTVSSALTGGTGNSTMLIVYVVFLVALFYFLLIRPQRKQKQEKNKLMSAMSVGDEIYSIGGILGTVTRIKDNTVWMRVSEKTEIELLKSSIGGLYKRNTEE